MGIDDPVVIQEHDPGWAEIFITEAARLRAALGDRCVAVHHIGSTSVPGMPAKPIIDMIVAVNVPVGSRGINAAMRGLGYANHGEFGIPGRVFFRRDEEPRVHAHVFPEGHPSVARDLGFRDRLRADAALAQRYAEMKRRLADAHRHDRPAYSRGKEDFIVASAGPRPEPRWA